MRDLRMESALGQNQPRQLFNKSMYSLGSRESNGNSLPGHAQAPRNAYHHQTMSEKSNYANRYSRSALDKNENFSIERN